MESVACTTTRIFCGSVALSRVLRLTPRKASAGLAWEVKPCRSGAEEHSREQRQAKGECQHGQGWRGIDGHILRAMKNESDDELYAEVGYRNSGDAAEHGEHDAFRERLANEPPAGCAQSQPDRGL